MRKEDGESISVRILTSQYVRSPWWRLAIDPAEPRSTAANLFTDDPCGWNAYRDGATGGMNTKHSGKWFSIHLTSPLPIGTIMEQEAQTEMQRMAGRDGRGEWEVDNFAFHLLTAKHVVIIVSCPLVYLPLEDSCPLFVTMGPDNQLSMCPLSDVIYITRMSLLCCPLSACDQSFLAQTQNRPLTEHG